LDDVTERETMEFDVVIVGAGPAGLAAAIRLKQLAAETGKDVSVVVLEKGSQVGAHILSGAVIDPVALDRLLPQWREQDSPLQTQVSEDRFYYLTENSGIGFPSFLMPPLMSNHGCYIGSLGSLCRWLGEQAEALGVEIYPGISVIDAMFGPNGEVEGVITETSDVADFFGGLHENHRVGRRVRKVRLVLAVVLAHRRRGRNALPEQRFQLGEDGLVELARLVHKVYFNLISASKGTFTPRAGISSVIFAGMLSVPFSLPDSTAFWTACSISCWELTPTILRNLRMLRLNVSWSMARLLILLSRGSFLPVLCPARHPTGRSC
jgi:hypothetical protein